MSVSLVEAPSSSAATASRRRSRTIRLMPFGILSRRLRRNDTGLLPSSLGNSAVGVLTAPRYLFAEPRRGTETLQRTIRFELHFGDAEAPGLPFIYVEFDGQRVMRNLVTALPDSPSARQRPEFAPESG